MLPGLPNTQPDDDPIGRIVAAIVGYAIKDGAREIHLRALSPRSAVIFYRLREGEELHEQMKIPFYVWKPLRERLEEMAGDDGAFQIDLKDEKQRISLSYRVEMKVQNAPDGETLVLKLTGELNSPA